MEITKKINLEAGKYNILKDIIVNGVKVKGSLSPYDIPRQATVSYDRLGREYRIHFAYLTPDEPKKQTKISPEIWLFMGQSSGKLYDIVIRKQEQESIREIILRLIAKIDDLAQETERSTPPNYIKELNLLVAKKFLEENQDLYSLAG
jgi:hypothetical protein